MDRRHLAWAIILGLAGLAHPGLAAAADESIAAVNGTTPGALTAYATILSAGFERFIAGDENSHRAGTAEYRKLGDTVGKTAQAPLACRHRICTPYGDPATTRLLGLSAADAVAQRGDAFVLLPGTYHGTFAPRRDGTATLPISYVGTAQASVILDGDGGTFSTSHCLNLISRKYLQFE